MVTNLLFSTKFAFYSYLSVFMLFFCSIDSKAQCAGIDNTLPDVCNILDPNSKFIDLSSGLGPHTAGGTWTDNGLSGGLNVATGILNAQQITRSGIYTYTYTVNNVVGCTDNSATVMVTIGPYAGVPSIANTCSDNSSYNLFQAFDIRIAPPQINGTWHDDDASGGLSGSILDATIPVEGQTYRYTYTVGAVGGCTVPSSEQIEVTIVPVPDPGNTTDLQLCSDQLSSYTNYNLNNSLSGQDPNGFWSENGTTELSGPTDSSIDIQNIYNTKGPGIYSFSYIVLGNGLCPRSATVNITLEKKLDFTGLTLDIDRDICEDEISTATYKAVLTQVPPVIANGSYTVTYTISGEALPLTATRNFVNGVLEFPIPSSHFQQVNNYTITILNIKDPNSLGICNNIVGTINDVLHVYPIPKIDNATLKIDPVCKTFDALVEFSGNSNLADGNYTILYNLSGSNISNAIPPIDISVIGGVSSFTVSSTLLPNAGTTTLAITKIKNKDTGCTNISTLRQPFTIYPLPDVTNLRIVIKDVCQGQPATVQLTGLGTLTSISIDYNLLGANTVAPQTIPLTVVAGETSFIIPATDVPNLGLTTLTITNITNTVTGCSLSITKKGNFIINPIPALPIADAIQPFCIADNATVANLNPQGNQYQWFDSATSTVPLVITTPLVSGNYFVKEVNATTKCESGLKQISVVINTTPQINSATITILPVCQGFDSTVNFSGTSNLADGNYGILYNLTGSNIATGISATLTITNGQGSFDINTALIPNAGNTTIAITNITNTLTSCSNTSTLTQAFAVNAVPDVTNMVVTVKDGCLGQDVNVDLTGLGTLTNIAVSYTVSDSNTISSQTIPLIVTSGKTNFLIPASSLLNTGSNTLVINNLTNTNNGCSPIMNPVSNNFAINGLPASPTADNQKFCETDYATVSSLKPSGNQYKWYDSATSTTALTSNALLGTADYYLREANAVTACESLPTQISVLINVVPAPVLQPSGQDFCGVDKPTIQTLSDNTTNNGNLTWYDAATNGVQLANSDLLTEGATYYGFDYSSTTQCYSVPLAVTVSLTDCTATPENFFIPDGFSPNGDGVNETFQIIDIEFLFPNYTLEIYNRYGNIMFQGNISKAAWDGKNSNTSFIDDNAPSGVYFYIINFNKDNLPPKQGQLYLNR